MADTKFSVTFTNSRKKYLNLHYNKANSFLHANGVNIHELKAKDSRMSIESGKYFRRLYV